MLVILSDLWKENAQVRRIIVLGGFGFFGGLLVDHLRIAGLSPLIGSRRSIADIVIDVEDYDSIRTALRAGDIVIDAAGPFQTRTTTLVEMAIEIGLDIIDLADALDYVGAVYKLQDRIAAAQIRVFPACSTMSSVSATMVSMSGIVDPARVTGILVPSTKYTAVEGTAASLFSSIGRPLQVFEDGKMITRLGWQSSRNFAMPFPIEKTKGYLFESADSITLPLVWPSLHSVSFFVVTNVTGLDTLFRIAARTKWLRQILDKYQRWGLRFSRLLGHKFGGVGYEIESRQGHIVRLALTSANRGFLAPIAPAVLVARMLSEDRCREVGLVSANRQVMPAELVDYLAVLGIHLSIEPAVVSSPPQTPA